MLATQFGAHAVRLIVERKFGHMVTYQPPDMKDVPIIDAIKLATRLPELLRGAGRPGPGHLALATTTASCRSSTSLPERAAAGECTRVTRQRPARRSRAVTKRARQST